MKQLRNWKEIAEIPCPETRYALAVCGHEGVKARLRFAFPECFIPARDDQTDLFSWRHLLEVAEHTQAKEDEARPPYPALAHMWLQYLQPALSDPNFAAFRGIPIKAQWGEMWWGERTQNAIPEDIIVQLIPLQGTVIKGPLFLEYKGTRCVVGCIWFDNAHAHMVPSSAEKIKNGLMELALVPADVIAFDC